MHLKNKKKIYTSLGCELIKRNIGAGGNTVQFF